MELVNLLVVNLGVIAGVMLSLWLVSLWLGNSSIVDIFWGGGFVIIAWVSGLLSDSDSARKWIIVALASIWGLRLTAYLAWRNIGKGERCVITTANASGSSASTPSSGCRA